MAKISKVDAFIRLTVRKGTSNNKNTSQAQQIIMESISRDISSNKFSNSIRLSRKEKKLFRGTK